MTEKTFQDKTVLITGAGKRTGIAYGIARKIASCGANVVLTDLDTHGVQSGPIALGSMEEMKAIAGELKEEFAVETLALPMDVCLSESIQTAMEAVKERFGRLDILYNNAGAAIGAPSVTHQYDEEAWIKTVDVNLHGVFRVSKAAVKLMKAEGGAIVNVASRAGKTPAKLNGAYSASKAGVIMLTKVMAQELASENIRVNAICPGFIKTELQQGNIALKSFTLGTSMEEAEKQMLSAVPLARMGTIDEVADLCAYLASDQSSYITGQAINIGGGLLTEL